MWETSQCSLAVDKTVLKLSKQQQFVPMTFGAESFHVTELRGFVKVLDPLSYK